MKWKFMQIEPQPARGTLRKEMWDSPEWIAEEKYDGDRRIAQFCGRVVRFTGRRQSIKNGLFVEKTENVPHLSGVDPKWLKEQARRYGSDNAWVEKWSKAGTPGLPPAALEGTVLDGEMICSAHGTFGGQIIADMEHRGGESKFVTSIMGSLPEEAIRKQIERGWLRYVVFDCLFYKGKDIRLITLDQRRQMALTAVEDWRNPFVHFAESSGYGRASGAEHKRTMYDVIVKRGGEGVILKFIHGQYGDKGAWVKVKKRATADVVIMGFVPAKEMSVKKGEDKATLTKYAKAGLIGAIQCGQYDGDDAIRQSRHLREVATVSGMTDTLRKSFTMFPDKYVGSVITIEHNGREPTGRFRHPRLEDNTDPFRNDKRAKDCVYREDET